MLEDTGQYAVIDVLLHGGKIDRGKFQVLAHAYGGDSQHTQPGIIQFRIDQYRQLTSQHLGYTSRAVNFPTHPFVLFAKSNLERLLDLDGLENFQLIAFPDIVVVLDTHTTFGSGLHFHNVFLETAQ